MIVVADAGPLIHLSLVRRLGLLPTLYGKILVPDLVFSEVVKEGDTLPGSADLRGADWIERIPHDPRAPLFQLLRAQLDAGEAAALWVAVDRKAELVLSDDRPARLAAEHLGFSIKGTLGLLVQAKRRGLLGEVAPLVAELKSRGVWLSPRLVERVLTDAGEA